MAAWAWSQVLAQVRGRCSALRPSPTLHLSAVASGTTGNWRRTTDRLPAAIRDRDRVAAQRDVARAPLERTTFETVERQRAGAGLAPVELVGQPESDHAGSCCHPRIAAVSYTHLRAHETPEHLVCRLLLEKKKR